MKQFGHVQRRKSDVLKEDMQTRGGVEVDAGDGLSWRWMIHCGDPQREHLKEERRLACCAVVSPAV